MQNQTKPLPAKSGTRKLKQPVPDPKAGNPMKNRLSPALVVTSSLLAQPARADPLTTQNRLDLAKTVIAELQSGRFMTFFLDSLERLGRLLPNDAVHDPARLFQAFQFAFRESGRLFQARGDRRLTFS
jgi:hypothetical protein